MGDEADADEHGGPEVEVIDARGAATVPRDRRQRDHGRLGSNPLEVDLAGAATLEELRGRVQAYAEAHPEHRVDPRGWVELRRPSQGPYRRGRTSRSHRRASRVPVQLTSITSG
ncbi:MAG: hypothetical protein U0V56_11560 [Actinomycetota bacterium]